jgi:hypothetical protein
MILIIGSLGNMGKRYGAILDHLGVEYIGCDIKQPDFDIKAQQAVIACDKIIIATPTHKHLETLQFIGSVRRTAALPTAHVLCEKPIVTKPEQFRWVRKEQESGLRIFCVNNYAHHPEYPIFSGTIGRTHYNYYKHGSDGLAWDCFQLFVLAKGTLTLNDKSPVWTCRINGHQISSAGIDQSYISMIKDFLGPMHRVWDLNTSEIGMKKVVRWMEEDKSEESL